MRFNCRALHKCEYQSIALHLQGSAGMQGPASTALALPAACSAGEGSRAVLQGGLSCQLQLAVGGASHCAN